MLFVSEALLKCLEKGKLEVSINLPENHSQLCLGFFGLGVEETWEWAGKVEMCFFKHILNSLKHRISCCYYKQWNALLPYLVKKSRQAIYVVGILSERPPSTTINYCV